MTDNEIIEIMARAMWGECDRYSYESADPVSYDGGDDDYDMDRDLVRDEARAALTALRSAGLAIVPREITGDAAETLWHDIYEATSEPFANASDEYMGRVAYRTMIATAEGKTE